MYLIYLNNCFILYLLTYNIVIVYEYKLRIKMSQNLAKHLLNVQKVLATKINRNYVLFCVSWTLLESISKCSKLG